MTTARAHKRQRGVSLIEALVALVVMAFGVLGVAGVQATLRQNADIAKQRAEAVRIAQEAIEQWRAYRAVAADSGTAEVEYQEIVDIADTAVAGYSTNTSYTLTRSVVDAQTDDPLEPRRRSLQVEVSWADRAGDMQNIRLLTQISGTPPELAAARGVPADSAVTRRPRARHRAVPDSAVNQGDSGATSIFTPPGSSVTWTFDNNSGFITRVCNPTCTDVNYRLLAGYVSFATPVAPLPAAPPPSPGPTDAENPTSPAMSLDVFVDLVAPSAPPLVECFEEARPTYVAYYCAMPLTSTEPYRWSGRSRLVMTGIAATLASMSSTEYKVCRYTPADSDTPPGGNAAHPLDHVDVAESLANQNFLVIRAGNDSTAFECPDDDTSTVFRNTNTWRHQPLT